MSSLREDLARIRHENIQGMGIEQCLLECLARIKLKMNNIL